MNLKNIDLSTNKQLKDYIRFCDQNKRDIPVKNQTFWLKKSVNKIPERNAHLLRQDPPNKYVYNLEDDYRSFIKSKRSETRQRLRTRKLERVIVQKASSQSVVDQAQKNKSIRQTIGSLDRIQTRRIIMSKARTTPLLSNSFQNLWNDQSKKPQKLMKTSVKASYSNMQKDSMKTIRNKIVRHISHKNNSKLFQKIYHDVQHHQNKRRSPCYLDLRSKRSKTIGLVQRERNTLENPYRHFFNKNYSKLSKNKDNWYSTDDSFVQYKKDLKNIRKNKDDETNGRCSIHSEENLISLTTPLSKSGSNISFSHSLNLKNSDRLTIKDRRDKRKHQITINNQPINVSIKILKINIQDYNLEISNRGANKMHSINHLSSIQTNNSQISKNKKIQKPKKSEKSFITFIEEVNNAKKHSLNISSDDFNNITLNMSQHQEFNDMLIKKIIPLTSHLENDFIRELTSYSRQAQRRLKAFQSDFCNNRGRPNKLFQKMGFQNLEKAPKKRSISESIQR